MTKKRINIALIIIVLGLWGTVGYKTISQYFLKKENNIKEDQFAGNLNLDAIKKDTFNFESINRDPFLNKQYSKPDTIVKNYTRKPMSPPKLVVIKPKPVTIWPVVSYYGYIKSKIKTDELIMVKINNRLYKLRKNDDVEGLIIRNVYNDSVEISFNKEKRVVKVK